MVDLSQVPVLDIHAFSFAAHPWARRDITQLHWLGGVDLREAPAGTFTDESVEYLEHTIGFRLFVRELAAFLGCEPTADAVVAARNERLGDFDGYVKALFADIKLEQLIVDNGLQTLDEVDAFATDLGMPYAKTFRVETHILRLLENATTFDALIADFDSGMASAVRDSGCVAFKSVIAYRTGLDIKPVTEAEARASFDTRLDDVTWFGPRAKDLRDFLTRRGLAASADLGVPFMFHTGVGDTDVIINACNPALLTPMLLEEQMLRSKVVLIHGGWPYSEEAGWLTNNHPNVYLELSGNQPPHMEPPMSPRRYGDLLRQVAFPKMVFGTDGQDHPETVWYYAKYSKRSMGKALGALVDEGILTEDEALQAGRGFYFDNAKKLFGV
jgi:uncharacterized protein